MAQDIEIELSGRRVGTISFDDGPQRLHATRTASGFTLQLPAVIKLRAVKKDEPRPVVARLWGDIFAPVQSGGLINVGHLRLDEWEGGSVYTPPDSSYESERSVWPIWTGTFSDLAFFEKMRDGGQPKLSIHLKGELYFLIPDIHPFHAVRSEPYRIYSRMAYVEISYPKGAWVDMLRTLGVAENVLVEVPLPTSPPGKWTEGWGALVEARNYFEQGGTTGWKGCVAATRLALEKWQSIEKEDMGPGWKAPGPQERRDRTKKQRIDNLRWHLYQFAHLGPHSSADDWTRDDALLLLSTLSALLAERKP